MIYDIVLLVVFAIFASLFLHRNKKNLKKEGALILYKTQWGVKLIEKIGGKYKKTLRALSYVSIGMGYFLMAGILFIVVQSVYLYFTTSISQVVKAPPIAPLIPYFPQLFGMENLFPPFYFVYFIIALLIVASVHEFAHGIFARRYNIKIKSTGFAFFKYFPAILGAFVEQDENQMAKAKKFEQMSVLSAGVFANILTAVLFYVALFAFFSCAFTASGITFNTYSYSLVNTSDIVSINGVSINSYDEVLNLAEETNKISTGVKNYSATKEFLSRQEENSGVVLLYDDAPAINANLSYTIIEINGIKTDSMEMLQNELEKYSPDDKVEIVTFDGEKKKTQEIVLKKHPEKNSVWLGIGFYQNSENGFVQRVFSFFPSYKKPNVYYEPKNEFSIFFGDFLWWVFIINLLVAFFNMIPAGIFDGGRFFYLTVLGLTDSEKIAKKSFKLITSFILFLLLMLMVKWLFSFF